MDARKKSSTKNILIRTFFLLLKVAALFFFGVLFLAIMILSKIPSDKEIKGCLTTKLYNVNLCENSGNYTRLNQISPWLRKAVILSEDSAFYQHNGFDFQEIENSFKKNLQKGKFARGGSTISQQLVKNLFLTKEKTLSRKLMEALITLRVEKVLTKNQILEKYLNVVQFGKDLYGIKKAAKFYFNKEPSQLSIAQSAFLAFLLPGPEVYSKSFFKKQLTPFAERRLKEIISRMNQYSIISTDDYLLASGEIPYLFSGDVPAPAPEFTPVDIEQADEENLLIEDNLDQ